MAHDPVGGFFAGTTRVVRRHLTVWRRTALSSAVAYVGEPLLYLIALGYGLGRLVPSLGGMTYAEFIAPGLVASSVMYTSTFEGTFGSYTRLETQGTFDAILATPITVGELVAAEITFSAIRSAVSGTVVLLVAAAFGLVPSWSALFVPVLAFSAGLLFSAFAVVVTSVSKSYDAFNYYFTLAVAPMYLFGGVFFPLEDLPASLQRAAYFLPLTHVVALSRGLVRGALHVGLLGNAIAIIAFLVPAYWLAWRGIRRRVVR